MNKHLIVAGLMLTLAGQGCAGTTPDSGASPWGDPEPAAWEPEDVTLPPEGSAGQAVAAWMESRGLPAGLGVDFNRLEVDQDRPESARILMDGLRDDSLQGQEFELELEEADGAWRVRHLRQRAICRRGVGDDGLCL